MLLDRVRSLEIHLGRTKAISRASLPIYKTKILIMKEDLEMDLNRKVLLTPITQTQIITKAAEDLPVDLR